LGTDVEARQKEALVGQKKRKVLCLRHQGYKLLPNEGVLIFKLLKETKKILAKNHDLTP
jgi:hypothetical protein